MVMAFMEGRKTCTRRPFRVQPKDVYITRYGVTLLYDADGKLIKPPIQPGDLIYARETWACSDDVRPRIEHPYIYRADNRCVCPKWRPSIHMPKSVARIWRLVTDVRAERIRYITEEDVLNEGVSPDSDNLITAFAQMWESLYPGAWDRNEWVFRYGLTEVQR